MVWTYAGSPLNAGSASATAQQNLDAVRLCIGDTIQTDELLQDGEIQYFMQQESAGSLTGAMNIYRIASACCDAIATRFARLVDKEYGPAKLSASQKTAQYSQEAKKWLAKSRLWDTSVYAGGISVLDKQTVMENDDRVRPFFTRNMESIPGAVIPQNDPGWQPSTGT